MSDLAVIIVNWNTCALTLQALHSLYTDLATCNFSSQVWVVDNASHDDSVSAIQAQFPQTHLIVSPQNLGFAGGNNAALRALGADLPSAVYLLNSDTITHTGATQMLYEALMRLPNAGVVGARLSYGDGSFQHSAFKFPDLAQLWIDLLPSPARLYDSTINGRYPQNLYQQNAPFLVDHTLGATMMLKREVIQETGLFDEQFHIYCEEIDWSWRIQKAGWQIYCVPSAHITHLGGQSTGQIRAQSILNLWTARLQLYAKYYPAWKMALAKQIIRWGMARKIRHAETEELRRTYQQVIHMTWEKSR